MLNILYHLHFFDEVNSAYNSQWVFFMTFHRKVLITVLFLIQKMLLRASVKCVHVFTSRTSQPYELIDCFSIRWGHCLDFIEVESQTSTADHLVIVSNNVFFLIYFKVIVMLKIFHLLRRSEGVTVCFRWNVFHSKRGAKKQHKYSNSNG